MRDIITIVEGTVAPTVPSWWSEGKPITENEMGFEGYDIAEFLEDDEFDYQWRLCRVPVALLPTVNLAELAKKIGAQHQERIDSIRAWFDQAGIDAALTNTPPILLLHQGKIHRILDGWHRVAVARERHVETIMAAVGFGPGADV